MRRNERQVEKRLNMPMIKKHNNDGINLLFCNSTSTTTKGGTTEVGGEGDPSIDWEKKAKIGLPIGRSVCSIGRSGAKCGRTSDANGHSFAEGHSH
ncbi:hypothetical protein CDAR_435951 [Caerostris darwini]|uniref:Uncharacterized protein n=1 Tax=Caerostris darwini TaxID=1538125 RepID=A0AAV4SHT8_9ARAC|nr:hypothetical protein CDAR_435951 [Caerostris darwini]